MGKRRSLLPPQWPPKSFGDALKDDQNDAPEPPPTESGVNAYDPLARLDAISASPAWGAHNRESGQALAVVGGPSAALSPDAYRTELEQIGREIENLRLLLLQAEREIETQSQRQEAAQDEVAKIEHRLQQHTREEIRAAYAHASETEMRAFMASEQRDQMLAKLQAFERYERFLRGAIEALDAAAQQAPALPAQATPARGWSRIDPDRSSSRFAIDRDGDDDYESLWLTPTSPIPAVTITPSLPDEGEILDEGATISVSLADLHDDIDRQRKVGEAPTDESHAEEERDARTEFERPEGSIPLPRPQLPEDQSPWTTETVVDDQPVSESEPEPPLSQHIVVMGPRTASLAFRGENREQWEGAHAVLNRVVQAQEEIAERVARQVQEVSLHALTQLALETDYFEQQAAHDPKAALAGLQQVRAQLNAALQEANSALFSMRPMGLGGTSLVGALRRYAMSITTQYNLPFELHTPDRELPLAPETVKLAFRVAQEAMLNTARHAHASLMLVSLSYTSDAMRLVVEDDGVGFDAEQEVNRSIKRSSGGLLGMLERAELLGGRLRIDSMPGSGCNVDLLVPLPQR